MVRNEQHGLLFRCCCLVVILVFVVDGGGGGGSGVVGQTKKIRTGPSIEKLR